jgi:hypothetical protein
MFRYHYLNLKIRILVRPPEIPLLADDYLCNRLRAPRPSYLILNAHGVSWRNVFETIFKLETRASSLISVPLMSCPNSLKL